MMRQIVKRIIENVYFKINRINSKRICIKAYKSYLERNPKLGLPVKGEKEWIAKWKKYDKNISPLSYRIFSRYIGSDINILPMEVCVNLIEPILTPNNLASFYCDKNSFGLLYRKECMPQTFVYNINGKYYNGDYNTIKGDIDSYILSDEVIIKPSLESSGRGVMLFRKKDNLFINMDNEILSLSYLNRVYKKDFLIQECFTQSDYLSQFNPSSLNTLRISTYRDVKTGEFSYLRAFLRIGATGSIVDNAHAGGRFIGIDDNGKLGNYLCDQFGVKYILHNGIDFSQNEFVIPNYEDVKKFSIEVSKKFIHHSLLALDIILDKNNNPKLLEVNIQGFGGWAFQFTSGTCFREYTDDILEYCKNQNQTIKIVSKIK